MEAKEKAKDLCENLWQHIGGRFVDKATYDKQYDITRLCAMVVVDEILNQPYTVGKTLQEAGDIKQYWLDVKKEIEAL